jgi:hypothetical protein
LSAMLAVLLLAPAAGASPLEQFFIGTTQGAGTVSVIMSGSHAMRDRSRGHRDPDGALIIEQVIEEVGKPLRHRAWRLVRAGGDRILGKISDARGPVEGELRGNSLHLRYRMEEGPSVEQWITLRAGGRAASNRMTFHRFGMKVATVESEIRKIE